MVRRSDSISSSAFPDSLFQILDLRPYASHFLDELRRPLFGPAQLPADLVASRPQAVRFRYGRAPTSVQLQYAVDGWVSPAPFYRVAHEVGLVAYQFDADHPAPRNSLEAIPNRLGPSAARQHGL